MHWLKLHTNVKLGEINTKKLKNFHKNFKVWNSQIAAETQKTVFKIGKKRSCENQIRQIFPSQDYSSHQPHLVWPMIRVVGSCSPTIFGGHQVEED